MRTPPPARLLRRRVAFTLIELLIVIFIMGVLMAMLIPAVQSAREVGRKAGCANNLKQIGLAMQSYMNQYNTFPVNFGAQMSGKSPDPQSMQSYGRSWMIGLLPWLDEQRLYEQIRFDQPLMFPTNKEVAQTVIDSFICPTDRYKDGLDNQRDLLPNMEFWAVTNYKAVAGSNWNQGIAPSRWPDNRIDPITMMGVMNQISYWHGRNKYSNDGLDRGNGVICRGNLEPLQVTSQLDVADGMSNTLAVGEAVPRLCSKTWWYWWDGSTATCGVPLNWKPPNQSEPVTCGAPMSTYNFISRHAQGAFFLIADGHVRFMRDEIDLTLYRDLANISTQLGSDTMPPE